MNFELFRGIFVFFRGIFVFFRGKNVGAFLYFLGAFLSFFRGIFVLFRGDFNMIPFYVKEINLVQELNKKTKENNTCVYISFLCVRFQVGNKS